ncbi:MAG TPA: 1,4-dihydroxy-6-naphthoate synthase [Chitinophagaceae bacterium]|nr:1,4-dihydroxy-6-naphthoate synthase [Chitinophagaceae bacterium]
MSTTYTLGFSPCPNDTFIFDAMVNGKIDTEGLTFEAVMEDVETLNEWAFRGKLDITKLSFRALLDVTAQYRILQAGSALGQGCGPLLIAREPVSREDIAGCRIAIPGVHTTANMLLSFAFPEANDRHPVLFSDIEGAVLNGQYDLGLIIHESRFTYQEKGLQKIMDLGEYWEQKTGCPIPLGGIAASRAIPHDAQQKIDRVIAKSLDYAWAAYPDLSDFITSHAQEMEPSVMRQHIELYVNDFTTELGDAGRSAILKMLALIPGAGQRDTSDLFV